MGYVKTAATALAFYFLANGAQATGMQPAKTGGIAAAKKQELILPQSVKMQFSREKERLERRFTDSLEIRDGKVVGHLDSGRTITPSIDSTATEDSTGTSNAKDSSITTKKKMRRAQNQLGVNTDDFLALSPQDSAAYVDSLKAKMNRVLPHKKYRNNPLETYSEWLARLEDFVKRLEAFGQFVVREKEEKDSLKTAATQDTLRLLPDETVLEIARLLPEGDGSTQMLFVKRAIAHRLLKKYAELVNVYDMGTIDAVDSALAGRIDLAYEKVCDSTHSSHSPKRNANVKFRDLLMYYIYDACANESYGSYKMSIDVMSSLTSWAYNPEEKKKIIAGSVKAILAKFYEIRQGTVDFGWLLQTHRAPFNLSRNSLYELAAPQDVYERAEKLRAAISELEMDVNGGTSKPEKIADRLSDLKEDVGMFFDYVKGRDRELGEENTDGSLVSLCGWVQKSYDETEKTARDRGIIK